MIRSCQAGKSAMARFSAQLRFPSAALDGKAVVEQLGKQLMALFQSADLAVTYCGPTGLTAQTSDRRDCCDQKLVLSWGQAAGAVGVMALLLELQSQEAMACGAPLTLRSFSQLLQSLQEALPELEVLERSDRRQGKAAPGRSSVREDNQQMIE